MESTISTGAPNVPWNKDKLTGQKSPLKLKEIWAIRIRLQLGAKIPDLAMFNLAIDSKLRACDLTKLRVRDVCLGTRVAPRATVMQQKTQQPVQFEITEQTRDSVEDRIKAAALSLRTFCSRAAFTRRPTFRPASMRGSSIAGMNCYSCMPADSYSRTRVGEGRGARGPEFAPTLPRGDAHDRRQSDGT